MKKEIYSIELVNNIKDALISKDETLAVAESVTSGHLQAAFSLADNATLFFQGGITAYHLAQKYRHLQIDPIYASKVNCVSERIAAEMATGVCRLFSSGYGISITGYASEIPEMNIYELYAFMAFAKEEKILTSQRITTNKKTMLEAQLDYTDQVLKIIAHYLG